MSRLLRIQIFQIISHHRMLKSRPLISIPHSTISWLLFRSKQKKIQNTFIHRSKEQCRTPSRTIRNFTKSYLKVYFAFVIPRIPFTYVHSISHWMMLIFKITATTTTTTEINRIDDNNSSQPPTLNSGSALLRTTDANQIQQNFHISAYHHPLSSSSSLLSNNSLSTGGTQVTLRILTITPIHITRSCQVTLSLSLTCNR